MLNDYKDGFKLNVFLLHLKLGLFFNKRYENTANLTAASKMMGGSDGQLVN